MHGVNVPRLLISGRAGVGKSSLLGKMSELLKAAGVSFAPGDLDNLSWS